MRRLLKEMLTEKPPRFWYTAMFCYAFVLPFLLTGLYVVINLVLQKLDMSNRLVLVMATGLNYVHLLALVLWIYVAFGWLIDYGLPWVWRRIGV